MARFVPVNKRPLFLEGNPPPMSKAQLEGFDFTSDPKTIIVRYTATFTLPEVGPVTAPVREPWTWDGKEWFIKVDDTGRPFPTTNSA
ncbi:MAG TPA: hypothetical protein VGK48_18795, partial [Terriglobia bacterium]